eukprot:Rhum_TRINITY_DN5334_c0_g1::Rhum_TRINITY_DN5334_c0_g1_i1::g.17020::m.17020
MLLLLFFSVFSSGVLFFSFFSGGFWCFYVHIDTSQPRLLPSAFLPLPAQPPVPRGQRGDRRRLQECRGHRVVVRIGDNSRRRRGSGDGGDGGASGVCETRNRNRAATPFLVGALAPRTLSIVPPNRVRHRRAVAVLLVQPLALDVREDARRHQAVGRGKVVPRGELADLLGDGNALTDLCGRHVAVDVVHAVGQRQHVEAGTVLVDVRRQLVPGTLDDQEVKLGHQLLTRAPVLRRPLSQVRPRLQPVRPDDEHEVDARVLLAEQRQHVVRGQRPVPEHLDVRHLHREVRREARVDGDLQHHVPVGRLRLHLRLVRAGAARHHQHLVGQPGVHDLRCAAEMPVCDRVEGTAVHGDAAPPLAPRARVAPDFGRVAGHVPLFAVDVVHAAAADGTQAAAGILREADGGTARRGAQEGTPAAAEKARHCVCAKCVCGWVGGYTNEVQIL